MWFVFKRTAEDAEYEHDDGSSEDDSDFSDDLDSDGYDSDSDEYDSDSDEYDSDGSYDWGEAPDDDSEDYAGITFPM